MLVAQLASSGGLRAPLAHIANQDDVVLERSASARVECAHESAWPFAQPTCADDRYGLDASYSELSYDVLELYVYDSDPEEGTGAADSVVRFTVAP